MASRIRTCAVAPRRYFRTAAAALISVATADLSAAAEGERERTARAEMVRTIAAIAAEAGGDAVPRAIDPTVLAVMGRVPRHEFVPAAERDSAYEDRPLPIGYGQTISQPYIVALMTDLLKLPRGGTALEVGTGSGYQAAVLAELGARVYTMEIVPQLARDAADRLRNLGYGKVDVRQGDGYHGWPEAAPFDGIVVTAAATQIPPPLVAQLKPGGRMVIPVGPAFMVQQLLLVEKTADGRITTEVLLPVSFVPLTRESPT
jgi:protein-L-isoaspartate(D-aspartate) O-methyltransferase